MKKILFVIESLSGGGAEKILVDLLRNLDKSKYEITVLAISEAGIYTEEVKKLCNYRKILPDFSKIDTVWEKFFYKLRYKLVYSLPTEIIASCYIKEKFDIEIAFVEGYATKLVAASKHKNRKIAWVHTDFEQNHWTSKVFKNGSEEQKAYKKFSKILCVSERVRDSFVNLMGRKEHTFVQYNPLDINAVKVKSGELLNLEHKTFRFITVGRLVEQKGYDRLLDVANKLKIEGYVFEIYILGEGSERENLEYKLEKYDLKNNVFLLGFQKNPYKYMKQSDMFLCSSRAEGFSTVATEALVLGLPILTTDCSGMRELFGNYNCGMIVSNNEEGLYRGMKKILLDTDFIKHYEGDIKKRAKEFDVQKRMIEIEELFDEKDINYE